jgi:type II secretory pathway component PulM
VGYAANALLTNTTCDVLSMTNSYAIPSKPQGDHRLPMVRLDPDKAASFRKLARRKGLSTTAALAALVNTHAQVRQPLSPRIRKAQGESARFTAALPDCRVSATASDALRADAQAAGVSLAEALRQLVDRGLTTKD